MQFWKFNFIIVTNNQQKFNWKLTSGNYRNLKQTNMKYVIDFKSRKHAALVLLHVNLKTTLKTVNLKRCFFF